MSSALLGLVAALSWGVNDFLARFPARTVSPIPTVLAVTFAGLAFLFGLVRHERRHRPHLLAAALAPGGKRHLSRACDTLAFRSASSRSDFARRSDCRNLPSALHDLCLGARYTAERYAMVRDRCGDRRRRDRFKGRQHLREFGAHPDGKAQNHFLHSPFVRASVLPWRRSADRLRSPYLARLLP